MQNTITRLAISADAEAQRVWACRWIERGLAAYEARADRLSSRFSIGDRLTMADLYLTPQVRAAERHDADLSAMPRVRAIYQACLETPEARATQPDPALAGR